MSQLIFIDCETGGLSPETDALPSIGLVDWRDGQIAATDEITIRSEGLLVSPDALAVNRIDLAVHDEHAIPRLEAGRAIGAWITGCWRDRSYPKVAGHNVAFDIGFVSVLIGADRWRKAVHGSAVDTIALLTFLEHAGKLPPKLGRLDAACAHFGIVIPPQSRHTALGDAVATAQLYTRLLELVG